MNPATDLTAAAERAISVARSRLVLNHPFFGCLALGLIVARRDIVETMATDGRHLFFNAAWTLDLIEDEREGVVAHEVVHCADGHHVRRGNRDLLNWNIACDLAINPQLIAAGFRLPKGMLLDPQFAGMGAEEIYALRGRAAAAKRCQPQQPGGQQTNSGGQPSGQPEPGNGGFGKPAPGAGAQPGGKAPPDASGTGGSGPGASGTAGPAPGVPGQPDATGGPVAGGPAAGPGNHGGTDPGQCGGVMDAAPDKNGIDAAASDWAGRVKQAAAVARQIGRGTLPGDVAMIVAELDRPRNDWRATLRRFVEDSARRDSSWSRPNRRLLHSGLVLPGSVPDGMGRLVIVADTSGSLDSESARSAVATELVGAAEESGADRVTVIWADARVQSIQEFQAGDGMSAADLKPQGGGGTDFRDSFRWIVANAGDAAAVVYVTDMDTSNWGTDPGVPVLWAATCSAAALRRRVPPFGETILVDPDM